MNRIKVLVVDDSFFIRKTLSRLIESYDIEVIGTASNGKEAIELVTKLNPDIVTMDIEMPVMNGLDALRTIMDTNPVPVLMVSTLTTEGAESTIEALSLGAIDFIAKKPAFNELHSMKDEIVDKIRNIAGNENLRNQLIRKSRMLQMQKRLATSTDLLQNNKSLQKIHDNFSTETPQIQNRTKILKKPKANRIKALCIGISTGGPVALQEILPYFPANMPVPVLIVQHMPPHFTKSLAERLDKLCVLHVKEAEHGEKIQAGTIYFAPGGSQMQLTSNGEINISKSFPNELFKPSINVLINSAADLFGKEILAIIMTGMGSDGTLALKKLHELGGFIVAQTYESCVVAGMPRSAIEAGAVDEILSLNDIPEYITSIFDKK